MLCARVAAGKAVRSKRGVLWPLGTLRPGPKMAAGYVKAAYNHVAAVARCEPVAHFGWVQVERGTLPSHWYVRRLGGENGQRHGCRGATLAGKKTKDTTCSVAQPGDSDSAATRNTQAPEPLWHGLPFIHPSAKTRASPSASELHSGIWPNRQFHPPICTPQRNGSSAHLAKLGALSLSATDGRRDGLGELGQGTFPSFPCCSSPRKPLDLRRFVPPRGAETTVPFPPAATRRARCDLQVQGMRPAWSGI